MKGKKKILIVDDEPDNTSIFCLGLEDNGFEVDAYTDPQLALSAFKPGYYNLVILDIKMPKMNGFQLYDNIKKIDNLVKVCFLTAFGEGFTEEFRTRFAASSPSPNITFLRKPIRIDDLVKKVNQMTDNMYRLGFFK